MDTLPKRWFFAHNGQKLGPFNSEELEGKDIKPETLVWCSGMEDWKAAKDTSLADSLFGVPPEIPPSELSIPPLIGEPRPTQRASNERESNYLVRHWRGELTLARSYWLNVVGVTLVAGALQQLFLKADVPLNILAITALCSFLLFGAITVWQIVGFYRATREHMRSGESGIVTAWAWVGLSVLVFGCVKAITVNLFPETLEMVEILRGDPAMGKMGIELLPSGKEIEISGALPAGCANEFEAFIENAPSVNILQIDCRGGRVYEARKIGNIVAARHMITFVSGECESAATLIFLSGEKRFANVGAKIGFHAASFPGLPVEDAERANKEIEDAVVAAGVKPSFAERISKTPGTAMWYPTITELLEAGVINAPTHGERFGMSSATIRSLGNLEKQLLASPDFNALKETDPIGFGEVAEVYRAAVLEGLPEGSVMLRTRSIFTKKMVADLPYASDEALSQAMGFWVKLIDRYGESHPQEAFAFLFGSNDADPANAVETLPDYPTTEDAELATKIILSGGAKVPRSIDVALAQKDIRNVLTHMRDVSPELFAVFSDQKTYSEHPTEALRAARLYYYTIYSTLSQDEQGNLLRYSLTPN